MRKFYLLISVFILLSSLEGFSQTTYFSKSGSAVNTASNWNTQRDGLGTDAASFGTTNTWVIQNGHSMTLSGSTTWNVGASGTVRIESGGTWTNSSSGTVTIGTFQIYGGGTYVHNTASGTVIGTTKQFANTTNGGNGNGNYEVQNTGTAGLTTGITWGNVRINRSTATTQAVGNSAAFAEVRGNFVMDAFGAGTHDFRFTAGQTTTHNIDGDLIINGGNLNLKSGTGAVPVNLGGNLTITGGSLTTGSGTSTITFTGSNKTFTHSGGTLTSTNMNWALANGASLTMANNFTLSTTRTLTLNATSSLTVAAGVSLNLAGVADFGGQSVVLKSTAGGTARIAEITGTLTNASNVTVERFIPANVNRAWRLLSVPTTGTQTINASWQANTWITAPSGTGFDATTPGNSMQYFTGTALAGVSSTSDVLSAQPAYFLFVRGDRSSTHSNATITTATLSSTGTINQGSITRGTAGTGGANFSLIPNPYPSNIDFEAVRTDNGGDVSGPNAFYIWDANLNTVGGYRTITRTAGPTYTATPGGVDPNSRYIQSGQAFWIGSEQQLNFTEAMKTTSAPTTNAFRMSNITEGLSINLSIKHQNGSYFLADGVRAHYDNLYNAAVTAEDVKKLSNFNENLSISRNGTNMAIENRPIISSHDTIFLKLWNTGVMEYRFSVNPTNFTTGLNAYLEDAYLNTSTQISLTAATDVDFAVTADAGSKHIDRFRIVFRPSSVLPVSFTSIKAYEKGNAIEVAWNVAGENDIHHYEVEESADGRNFNTMASVKAKGNENSRVAYTSLDNSPITGNNYYRVKSVSLANEVKYTSIVNVRLGKEGEAVSVYPNPVKGNTVGLQLTNLEKGSYTLNVYNSTGQLVITKMIQHGGGSASEQITMPTSSTKGVYQLEVKREQSRFVQSIILQ